MLMCVRKKCWKCRNKIDVERAIEEKEYVEIPYTKQEDRNKVWYVIQCECCGSDNMYCYQLKE